MSSTAILDGYEHYLTSDGVRTLVGPVRHRASRRVAKAREQIAAKARQKITAVRNRNKENTLAPLGDDTPTRVIPAVQEGGPDDTTIVIPVIPGPDIKKFGDQVTKALEGLKLPTFTVGDPERPKGYKGTKREQKSVWARAKESVMDRLYDNTWHEMVQNTARTVGYVALTTTAVVVFAKAAFWVVML